METVSNENAITWEEEEIAKNDSKIKVDVVEIGMPDEDLLWERRMNRRCKEI